MPVENAMVDKLRMLRLERSASDEFADTYAQTTGPWVICRVHTPTFNDQKYDQTYGYERELTAMVAVEAEDGTLVDLKASDKVELESTAFQNGTWEVMGRPKPIRGLEDVIFWNVPLQKWDREEI